MFKLLMFTSFIWFEELPPVSLPPRYEMRKRRAKGDKKRRRGGNGLR